MGGSVTIRERTKDKRNEKDEKDHWMPRVEWGVLIHFF